MLCNFFRNAENGRKGKQDVTVICTQSLSVQERIGTAGAESQQQLVTAGHLNHHEQGSKGNSDGSDTDNALGLGSRNQSMLPLLKQCSIRSAELFKKRQDMFPVKGSFDDIAKEGDKQ